MFSGEAVLDALLDAGATGCEGHGIAVVADQGVDIGLGRGDASGLRTGRRQIRSIMVPVDNAPPAHIVIRAVL